MQVEQVSAPLSNGQERLWFLHQLDPGGSAYLVSSRFRLTGPLDLDAFQAAVDEVIRRHQVLRAVFVTRRGRPVQVIREIGPHPVTVADIEGPDPAARERQWQRRSEADVDQPFDLAAGPLLRFCLFRCHAREHRLIISMHHIVSDRMSMDVLLGELSEVYRARVRDERPQLPALVAQYSDIAAQHQSWLASPECARQISYWRRQLDGAPARVDLGGTPPKSPSPRPPGPAGEVPLAVTAERAERLAALAESHRTTLFTVLLAAYGLALGRCHGLNDLVVACPITDRSPETDHLIGFFVNTVPIRLTLPPGGTFEDVIRETRRAVFGAIEHRAVPFERIVSELQPPRRPGQPPYFQAVLNYTVDGAQRLELLGLQVDELPPPQISARAELALDVQERSDGRRLAGSLLYDPRIQSAETAGRTMAELRAVIDAATEERGQ
jgi:hypothetical protein